MTIGQETTNLRVGVREVVGLVVGGAVAGAVHFGVFRYFDRRDLSWCGDGLDGLACAVLSVFIIGAIAVVLGSIANWLILRIARVMYAGPTAFIATVAFSAWWLFIDALIDGTNWAVLPIMAPPIVLNLLAAGLFRVVAPKRLTVALIAVAVLIASVPLYAIGGNLENRRSSEKQEAAIRNADFITYDFGYLPPGYDASPPRYLDVGDAPFSEVTALQGNNNILEGDRGPISVASFRAPESFNPPANCGYDRPYRDFDPRTCEAIGTDASGATVFVRPDSNGDEYFVRRTNTVVVLSTPGFGAPMRLTEALRILNALKAYLRDE